MPIITINNQDYDIDTLPQAAKDQLQSLQFVDAELVRLQSQASVLQTARIAYGKALSEALANVQQSYGGDTIKL